MEPKQQLDAGVTWQGQVAALPQLIPGAEVVLERARERRGAVDRSSGAAERLADRPVTRRVEGHHLLDAQRCALARVESENVLDVILRLVQVALGLHRLRTREHASARGLRHVDPRLAGPHHQRDHLGSERPREGRLQVASLELPITGDALIADASVERRDDLEASRPVLRREGPFDCALVCVCHADEPAAVDGCLTTALVAKTQLASYDCATDVVLVAVGQQLDLVEPQHLLTLDPEPEDSPVRQVDQVLVEHRDPTHDRRLAVVAAMGVRPRVMDTVDVLPLGELLACRSNRSPVDVSASRRPSSRGLVGVVGERPVGRHRPLSDRPGARAADRAPPSRPGTEPLAGTPRSGSSTRRRRAPRIRSTG